MEEGWGPGPWVRVTRRGYRLAVCSPGRERLRPQRGHSSGDSWGHRTQTEGEGQAGDATQSTVLGGSGGPEGSAEPWGRRDGRPDPEGGVTGTEWGGGGRGRPGPRRHCRQGRGGGLGPRGP